MNKFINGMIAGAVVSASAVTAVNMVNQTSKKTHKTIGGTLHKLGDMADNMQK